MAATLCSYAVSQYKTYEKLRKLLITSHRLLWSAARFHRAISDVNLTNILRMSLMTTTITNLSFSLADTQIVFIRQTNQLSIVSNTVLEDPSTFYIVVFFLLVKLNNITFAY